MTDQDRDLMERYIYEVVRRLAREQRAEISMELRELIGDMASDSSMNEVLQKLGDPAIFARKYRNENRYLIGPDYYDNYEWVMKIVVFGIAVSAVVSAIVQAITTNSWINAVFKEMIENTFVSLACGFGIVTFIFAVLERQQVKVNLKEEKEWSVDELEKNKVSEKISWTPERLGPVPDKRGLISRADSVVSLIFEVVFSVLLIFAPYLFGAYVFDGGEFVRTIPLFNLDNWYLILPVLLLSILIGFIDDLVRLMKGCYCKVVMVSNIVAGLLQLILLYVALKILPIWNPAFLDEVSTEFGRNVTSKGDIFFYYGTDIFSNIILGFTLLVVCLELGTTIYKTIRYGIES